jgi:O-antigen chain-terminating bifunctional methyltransferase/kinase
MDKLLQKAVSALPELYQPLYGIDDETGRAPSRSCSDRLSEITKVIAAHPSGAPKVLDIGCAQGYMSLGIADKVPGSVVSGIDYLEQNINLCKLIAQRINSNATFSCEAFNEASFEKHLEDGYHVVLFLNVLHHLCTHLGSEETKRILNQAAAQVDFALIELASNKEQLEWVRNSLSDKDWLSGFHFVSKLNDFSTHVSDQKRSLYFCSNRYALIEGRIFEFSSFMNRSHANALGDEILGRRYYLSSSVVAKKFDFSGKFGRLNKVELLREIRYLRRVASPRLLAIEIGHEAGLVARECINGSLLIDTWRDSNGTAILRILCNTLTKLAELEKAGLYHHDLRPWNILMTPGGNIELIDFGSIHKRKKRHCFEDVLSLLSWFYTKKWDEGILAEFGIGGQQHYSVFNYVRRTATKDISFTDMLVSMTSDQNVEANPEFIYCHYDQLVSTQSRLRKAEKAVKQVQALTEWASSADAYAKSKVEEVEQLQREIESLKDKLASYQQHWIFHVFPHPNLKDK